MATRPRRNRTGGINPATGAVTLDEWGTIDARWVPQNDESWIIIDYDKPQTGAQRGRGSVRHPSRRGRGRRA